MPEPIRISTKPTAAQVEAIKAAGPGSIVSHPHVSLPGRRRQLEQALGRAGVPHRLVRTLGWTTKGPAPKAAPETADAQVDDSDPGDTVVDGDRQKSGRRKR
jgi:hypothetical protein